MVHALSEIRRVLIANGTLVDLRPLAENWPIEVISARESRPAGHVSDLPHGREDDAAANAALSKAAEDGWFRRVEEEFFPLSYYWESPREMDKYIEEEWADFTGLDDNVRKNVRSLWTLADADARVRVRLKMLITTWAKSA
jgi:hypothetical protein